MISALLLVGLAVAQDAVDVPVPTSELDSAAELAPCPEPVPCPEAEPCPDHSSSDDLLESLLLLLSSETGEVAAQRLGELGDPRAIPPLVHTARTRRVPVAQAACHALAAYPDALPALRILVTDDAVRVVVRQTAVEALGTMGSEPAADALVGLMQEDLPRDVRESILDTVRVRYPHRLDELQGEVTQRGTGWLMAGGAGALGYSLASVGYFGQANLEGLGGVTGAAAGGSLGFVVGRRMPIEAGDAAFLSSSVMVGTGSGVLLGCAVGGDTACWTGGLLGEVGGFGLGAALMERHQGTQVDTVEALVITTATTVSLGTGVSYVAGRNRGWGPSDRNARYQATQLATGLGLAGGLAAGHVVAPHVQLSGSDIGHMTLGGVWGGFTGGLALGRDSDGMSVPMGAGLGVLGGYALANPMELGGDAVFTGYSGMAYGSMVGLGGGLLFGEVFEFGPDTGETLLKSVVWVGGSAGMGLGSYLAWRNPAAIRGNDVVFTVLGTGWASWQTTGWWDLLDGSDETLGLNFLVPAVVGSASALASPRIDIGVGDTLSASSLGLWGAYLGVAGAVLGDASEDDTWMAALIASDVGLGAGVLLMSPVVDASPVVVGMADAGGVLGATTGAVVVALVFTEADPIIVASLVGAGVGAVGGGLAGRALERKDAARHARFLLPRPRLRLPGEWSLAPTTVTDGDIVAYGAGLKVTGW